jgi:hypothetical protein
VDKEVPRQQTLGLVVPPLEIAVRAFPGVTEHDRIGWDRLGPAERDAADRGGRHRDDTVRPADLDPGDRPARASTDGGVQPIVDACLDEDGARFSHPTPSENYFPHRL